MTISGNIKEYLQSGMACEPGLQENDYSALKQTLNTVLPVMFRDKACSIERGSAAGHLPGSIDLHIFFC